MLDIKLGFRPEQAPIPTSQIAQDVIDQAEMIEQDVRRKAMQAHIKDKAYYDKNANASKLKEADYVYVLQPKPDHNGSKSPFTQFRWLGPYINEKVQPNNNYLLRKIGTNKTQVLHHMRIRQLTSRQPPADIRITPQQWEPDLEVSLKHDHLYARAWKGDYEKPIFDAENNNATPPISPKFPAQSGLSTEEKQNKPGIVHECSPEFFPQTEQLCDVTDTYPYTEPDVETSSEQPNNSPTSTCSSKYNTRHETKPN